MSVRIGYACISVVMREKGVFASRTLRLDTLTKFGIDRARELAMANITDLAKLIEYNESVGIRFFRITSNLFPHMENYKVASELLSGYNLEFAEAEIRRVGELARKYNHRLTFHPGQFAQLGSPSEGVVDQTFRDLNLHARIFQIMGYKPEDGSVMIIHGGGTFGDKAAAIARWKARFRQLPPTTQQYIALENDEFQYSPEDLLPICEELGIPFCLDFFHLKCMLQIRAKKGGEEYIDPGADWGEDEELQMDGIVAKVAPPDVEPPAAVDNSDIEKQYNEILNDEKFFDRIARTWSVRGIKQKVHVSTQKVGERIGTHGDYVETGQISFAKVLEICRKYGADIMAECKQKDICALALLEKYFIKVPTSDGKFYWSLP